MEERYNLKSKLFKHLFYNLVAFSVILLIFGFFVLYTVKSITYNQVNNELMEGKESLQNLQISSIFDYDESINFFYGGTKKYDAFESIFEKEYKDYSLAQRLKNPKIVFMLYDEKGNLLNSDNLGRIENYVQEIANFAGKTEDKLYDIIIDGKYNYRCINFKIDYSGDENDRIVQLLVNIDSEYSLMSSYTKVIYSSVALGILLSFVASFILSKYTLKPLEENYEKQVEFIQNASHELRTPLTIIQAKQELLLEEPEAKIIDKSEEIVLTINETKRLAKLTKDLMMLTRADNSTLVLKKESVNLDEFIENSVKPYKEIAELQMKEITCNLNFKKEIKIDTNRIYELIVILLDNALKYTEPNDKIEINTFLKDGKCAIEVKDTGIGISDEGLKRIFERFYREDKARSRETGGNGLGLSIAHDIVVLHGGNIKVGHNTPKGTIFTLKLPL